MQPVQPGGRGRCLLRQASGGPGRGRKATVGARLLMQPARLSGANARPGAMALILPLRRARLAVAESRRVGEVLGIWLALAG